ncbi:class I adenylate-forming enzyme family protein [Paenibacillus sp. MMS18-CY102]|uniref:class I adenylate-forming enzyme family protein n=1 Tax=Paenibacillus sp. MMS18-CY102 TaxID=2682849 RepID=UPI001365AD57|nr:fatty acid--CoA ligase family protein [Paenibacillus sp. MMS18-CY102]MWC29876.1 AMP-binding protein [Paenibacillus sp. MMS18-CY102]
MHQQPNQFDLLERFRQYEPRTAFVWKDVAFTYGWLLQRIDQMKNEMAEAGIERAIVSLEEDYSPYAIAALFALLELNCIVIPLDRKLVEAKKEEYISIAEAHARIQDVEEHAHMRVLRHEGVQHPLLLAMLEEGAAGLIIFSSGSTGKSKAAVHRADRLLRKYTNAGRALRTIPFMMFDHIGGLNTLLQTLSSGGTLYMLPDRSPAEVCRTIEHYRVQALPVSPTFLNLLLISGAHHEYDLSSLEVVSYGSEVMPTSTLAAWNEQFPDVRMVQAYGMSELGILPTKSKGSDSLLFSLRGEEARYRIVDGMLEVLADTAMAGYLNAPDPFTEDGWLRTGDEAVVEDGCIRILGRRSELINVGGEKVYPAEVEDVLHMLDEIEEVVVSGEPSGVTGQLVKATVKLRDCDLTLGELRRRIWAFCHDKLPSYKIPQKIVITEESLMGDRMKKIRIPQS